MKQFYLLLTLPLFALAFQSCEEEPVIDDHGNNGNSSKMVFTATTENLESSADVEAFWLPGEQIKIVLNDGNSVVATLVDGAGTSTASFVGTIPGGKTALFAVHPTSALDSAEGNAANINIPDSQSGGSAPETISVGKIETGNKIDFKNVNAVLGLQLKAGTEVSKIEVTSVKDISAETRKQMAAEKMAAVKSAEDFAHEQGRLAAFCEMEKAYLEMAQKVKAQEPEPEEE